MQEEQEEPFSDRLKYSPERSTLSRKRIEPSPSVECSSNANCNRPKHAGLHQSQHPHQQHCADLPGCCVTGSRRSSDPVHPRDCRTRVLNLRGHREHDRRTYEKRVQVSGEGESKHADCNRPEHARLSESVNADLEYRAHIPGRGKPCGGGRPDPLHPGYRGTGILDLRGNSFHDRRPHALGVPVKKSERALAGGLQARFLLLAIFFLTVLSPIVSAVTISFSPVGMDPDDLHVYNSTGALIGIYNTSSTAISLSDNQSYSILVVPASTNLMGNHPDAWFELFVTKMRENAIGIIVLLFAVGLLIAAYRR
jgi:hypothetical protein